jgi:outer membrane receptor for ferrienterochelin and colicins
LSYKDFSLEGAYSSREKGIPTGSFDTVFGDTDTRTTDARGYLNLKYDHRFANGLGMTGRLYYDYFRYNGDYIYDQAEAGQPRRIVPYKDYGYGDWAGGEFQLDKRLFDKHHVIVGAEYRSFFRQDQGAYDVKPDFTYFDTRNQTYAWALYAQDEFRIRDNLILNAGLRYDYYGTFGGTLNPRLALIYEPFKKTAVKLLYGTAFRAPNAFELYYGDETITKTTGLLEPETIDTYEIVLERYLTDQLRLSVSGYYYSIENLISQIAGPKEGQTHYQNLDNVTARGIELQLDGKLPWWEIETRASYAWQLTEDGETGKVLSNSPKHQAKLNVAVPLYQDKLFAGTELRYMSPRKTLLSKDSDDVLTTNLTLFSRGFLKGLELSAGVYNLFDERHGDPGGEEHVQDLIQQDGRTFRVKLKYSF